MFLIDSDYDFSKEKRRFHSRNLKPTRVIEAFRRSEKPVMELEFNSHEYSNSSSCRSSFANALRRMGYDYILIKTRNGRVFLINTLVARCDDDA